MSAPTTVVPFRAQYARRIPDPNFHKSHGIERHILYVAARDLPEKLSLDPNARIPNTNKRVYREVRDSLLERSGVPGTFHLKHKGITLIAQSVDKKDEETYLVTFEEGFHGILDGGHSHELIAAAKAEVPDDQFVKVEILVGIPKDWIADIAGGLNTSVQVQQMSLDELAGKFKWIKSEIDGEPYEHEIAWRENEDGEFDARDIIAMLTCFNIERYPNKASGENHPVAAFSSKAKVLSDYEQNVDSYQKLRPILKDILRLHDIISYESREIWNQQGGKFGKLNFVAERGRTKFKFPFINKEGDYRLMDGAIYPMLAAFRWMVEEDPATGDFRWRGGFDAVLEMWASTAQDLLTKTRQANNELGYNPNTLGKSKNHWANLYAHVAMKDLMARAAMTPTM